jgi:hypothetical protein
MFLTKRKLLAVDDEKDLTSSLHTILNNAFADDMTEGSKGVGGSSNENSEGTN